MCIKLQEDADGSSYGQDLDYVFGLPISGMEWVIRSIQDLNFSAQNSAKM